MRGLEAGMSREELAAIRESVRSRGLPDPYRAFASQANGAWLRGIGWELSFAQWWTIWEQYYHLRGTGKNGLCMGREGDEGPYAVGNVYLTTNLGNLRDYHKSRRAAEARRLKKEKKEMAFARAGSASAASSGAKLSHLVWKARNTSKSTCNHKDDDLSYEMSAP